MQIGLEKLGIVVNGLLYLVGQKLLVFELLACLRDLLQMAWLLNLRLQLRARLNLAVGMLGQHLH